MATEQERVQVQAQALEMATDSVPSLELEKASALAQAVRLERGPAQASGPGRVPEKEMVHVDSRSYSRTAYRWACLRGLAPSMRRRRKGR